MQASKRTLAVLLALSTIGAIIDLGVNDPTGEMMLNWAALVLGIVVLIAQGIAMEIDVRRVRREYQATDNTAIVRVRRIIQ